MDHAEVSSIPEINAKHVDAAIIHEAAIGRINDEQLVKLRTLGMTEEEAEGCHNRKLPELKNVKNNWGRSTLLKCYVLIVD